MLFFRLFFVSLVFSYSFSVYAEASSCRLFLQDSSLHAVKALANTNLHSDLNVNSAKRAADRLRKWGIEESPLDKVELDQFLDASSSLYSKLNKKLRIFVKNETQLSVGSFKLRGALNKLARMHEENRAALSRGVVAASAGNHAQGLAYAGRLFDAPVTIVMPVSTPKNKVQRTLSHNKDGYNGVRVILFGESYDKAYEHAMSLSKTEKQTLVHAFEDKDVIAGQATIGLEIQRQLDEMGLSADVVFSALGGGGLASGLGTVLKGQAEVIAVQSENAMANAEALMNGYRQHARALEKTLADGSNVTKASKLMLEIMRSRVDRVALVSESLLAKTISDFYELGGGSYNPNNKYVLEGAGALSAAGFRSALKDASFQEKVMNHDGVLNVVLVLSGKNIDGEVLMDLTGSAPVLKASGM